MCPEGQDYSMDNACSVCQGARLKAESLAVKVGAKSIAEVTKFSIRDAAGFFELLELTERERFIGQRILKEIRERLDFLLNVGLDYLTLDRAAATLSGGEGQRIRLATQIGSAWLACSTSWMSLASGYTRGTTVDCCRHCFDSATWATPCWWLSMMRKPCWPPTTSSIWDPEQESMGGRL